MSRLQVRIEPSEPNVSHCEGAHAGGHRRRSVVRHCCNFTLKLEIFVAHQLARAKMARDITDQFRESVRHAALNQGMDEAKVTKISRTLIIPKLSQRSAFSKAAGEIMKSISILNAFVLSHQKDYIDRHRSTEKDRDAIEHEVGMFVKACKDQIDVLKNSIGKEKVTDSAGWLGGMMGLSGNTDMVAHQHGVVLILSERLHLVTAYFDRLRAVRFQEAIEKSIPRQKRTAQLDTQTATQSSDWIHSRDVNETASHQEDVKEQTQDLLEEETRALQVELTSLLDTTQETKRKMIEMSALNHLFSTHVLQQAKQIEMLYQQAMEATENVERGNKEIRKAIERNSSSRTFLLLFLVVLPLALLFLHWYN